MWWHVFLTMYKGVSSVILLIISSRRTISFLKATTVVYTFHIPSNDNLARILCTTRKSDAPSEGREYRSFLSKQKEKDGNCCISCNRPHDSIAPRHYRQVCSIRFLVNILMTPITVCRRLTILNSLLHLPRPWRISTAARAPSAPVPTCSFTLACSSVSSWASCIACSISVSNSFRVPPHLPSAVIARLSSGNCGKSCKEIWVLESQYEALYVLWVSCQLIA